MPRHHLLTAMSKSHELFRFVATAVDLYRVQNCLYSTLTAFWAGSVLAYFERVKNIKPQDMAVLLPTIVSGIKASDRDLRLGSYIVLSHLAARADLSQETATLLAETMLVKMKEIHDVEEVEAALTTLSIVCERQGSPLASFSRKAGELSIQALTILARMAQKNDILALLEPLLPAVLDAAIEQEQLAAELHNILAAPSCPEQVTQVAVRCILASNGKQAGILPGRIKMLEAIEQRLPQDISLLSYAADPQDSKTVRLVAGVSRPLRFEPSVISSDIFARFSLVRRKQWDTNRTSNIGMLLSALLDCKKYCNPQATLRPSSHNMLSSTRCLIHRWKSHR